MRIDLPAHAPSAWRQALEHTSGGRCHIIDSTVRSALHDTTPLWDVKRIWCWLERLRVSHAAYHGIDAVPAPRAPRHLDLHASAQTIATDTDTWALCVDGDPLLYPHRAMTRNLWRDRTHAQLAWIQLAASTTQQPTILASQRVAVHPISVLWTWQHWLQQSLILLAQAMHSDQHAPVPHYCAPSRDTRGLRRRWSRFWRERGPKRWVIARCDDSSALVLHDTRFTLADPWPLGDGTVLAEYCETMSATGRLVHWDGEQCQPCLSAPHHLSYPGVYHIDGQWWLLPEGADSARLQMYRAPSPQGPWTPALVLSLSGDSATRWLDPTLVHKDGRWWLFVNASVQAGMGDHERLHLFSASRIDSEHWQPHPANPIVADARCARSAGRPFLAHGQWHRPAQDCSRSYGSAVRIRRMHWDSQHYSETAVRTLKPRHFHPDADGLHTYQYHPHTGECWIDLRLPAHS